MERFRCGDRYKVYVESEHGDLFEMTNVLSSISFMGCEGIIRTTIDFIGDGVPGLYRQVDRKEIKERISASEWKCDYCGRVNKKHDETCKSCGAVRSFIYG